MSETKDQNEAACGGSALTAELGNELPGKNARAILPLLEEIGERDAEIERLRNALVLAASWIESGRPIDGLARQMREVAKVPNAALTGGEAVPV